MLMNHWDYETCTWMMENGIVVGRRYFFLQASTYHEKKISAHRVEVWKMRGKISIFSCGRKANFGSNYQGLQENKGSRNGISLWIYSFSRIFMKLFKITFRSTSSKTLKH